MKIKKIYQDYINEKEYWGKAKLLELREDLGDTATFILKDYTVVKEQDVWGNWHKIHKPIPLTQLKIYSSRKYLVEFIESDVFPIGFKKIVNLRYLYKVGYFDEPIPEEEDLPEMIEVEVEDGDEIKYYKKIDKFIEFDGIECF